MFFPFECKNTRALLVTILISYWIASQLEDEQRDFIGNLLLCAGQIFICLNL